MHESGLMEIWKRKWWPQSQICSSNVKTEAKPIALLDVQSAFYIAFSKCHFILYSSIQPLICRFTRYSYLQNMVRYSYIIITHSSNVFVIGPYFHQSLSDALLIWFSLRIYHSSLFG